MMDVVRDGRTEDVLVRDVSVLDCTGREPSGRHDVVVRAGRITSIVPVGTSARLAGATVIEGAGCTLMPGLTDAHVHFALIGPAGDHGVEAWVVHVLRVARYI
jgi:imidazolonepropionase-like amidohydrolase